MFGMIVVLAIFGGIGVWSAVAPLARAVLAPAVLSVKGELKVVQHLEGGIVAEVYVEEGEHVTKDQLLVRLNPIQAGATVSRYRYQLDQALIRAARLEAELRGDDSITVSGEIQQRVSAVPAITEMVADEQDQLDARRESFNGNITILEQRIEQYNAQISGLNIQRQSRLDQIAIFEDEIVGLRDLYKKGFYPRSQVLAMERALVQLKGAVGSDDADIARAQSGAGESKSQIINMKQRFREQVVAELHEVQAEIADLKERVVVANDIYKRIEIRAPQSGIIQNLQVHTIGGVVNPGQALMEIAPQDKSLVVDARVSPTDVDSVSIGQDAEVRLTALNLRNTPTIFGIVKTISGDALTVRETGEQYFRARVEIPEDELRKLGAVKLSAGMPAEVLIQAGERTALEYLMKPLIDAYARGLNEE
ncbi:HlyD family type I secretion periplasmic adaptor subunit [Nisaea nitritireducens]|uniref:HlyD family type I secretion periplasmic adaptor subunit n=1 Tax=Nisaea nitritireducens TaxID=568392 RepID=UPI0018670D16|nr:HlyD family type I secretion periplasmic adaptor subunit [Nisaea nitritireducens]